MKKIIILLFCTISTFYSFCNKELNNNLFFNADFMSRVILRWEFEDLCDLIFEPAGRNYPTKDRHTFLTFDPNDVKSGSIIFVRDPIAFFKNVHPKIRYPYIILSHGDCSDKFLPVYNQFLNDDKIIAWFGIHPTCSYHKKFHPIPLGILQHFRKNLNEISGFIHDLRINKKKTKLLYMNFAKNYKQRRILYKIMGNKPFCTIAPTRLPFKQYMEELACHKFALSPAGAGPDTYRTWEALLVGTIPIVLCSYLNPLYEDLPVLVISDWNVINEKFLEEKYAEISKKKYNVEKLYIEFWKNKILATRDEFLRNYVGRVPESNV